MGGATVSPTVDKLLLKYTAVFKIAEGLKVVQQCYGMIHNSGCPSERWKDCQSRRHPTWYSDLHCRCGTEPRVQKIEESYVPPFTSNTWYRHAPLRIISVLGLATCIEA